MGARIEAFATVAGHRGPFGKKARRLADAAASACLERAGRSAKEVDLLVNAGVYRTRNLAEPALAALIQEDVGANPRARPGPDHGTFSFDVSNGGAGVITAFYLIDGFLADSIDLGLVVASDADPGTPVSPRFPFGAVGGAVLLAPGGKDEGFVGFQLDTYPEHQSLLRSEVRWVEREGHRGHNVLFIEEDPAYAARSVDCAAASIRRFLEGFGLRPWTLDLVLPSQHPGGFPAALARRLEIGEDRVARADDGLAGAHSAGPIAALAAADADGRLGRARDVLFVGVGSGISVGLALYRRPE